MRLKKKLLGKSNWFRDKKKIDEKTNIMAGPRTGNGTQESTDKPLRTRTVLFVEQTPRGALASKIREQLLHLGPTLGYKIRVVERSGRNILTHFPQLQT